MGDRVDPNVLSHDVVLKHKEVFEPLDESINEVYLWHGTNVRVALSIAQHDFDLSLAGSGAGTMYGAGAYLAESCTKADEYSGCDEPGGYYEGIYALFSAG